MNPHAKSQTLSVSRITRRNALRITAGSLLAVAFGDVTLGASKGAPKNRLINIMNFLRAEEPREPMDLMAPVRGQMELIKRYGLPATWLLQYNALVEGQFVEFLKAEMPAGHEVGFWFEVDRKLCDAAGISWRGRKDWGWDYHVPIAYLIGYTPEERIKLADAAISTFRNVWGHTPKSVASWNLDSLTIAYLSDKYGVDAFGVCRDQSNTDGFTIWGAPIAAYFPSRTNAWSPALEPSNQIHAPVFRLLGQDPVYYYNLSYPLADGRTYSAPDTMEPVWESGRSETFVREFLDMIAQAPCLGFSYAQLGQENSFGWPEMSKGFAMQMPILARMRDADELTVETMADTGRRFKKSFAVTPAQAQVQLNDPFGHADPAEQSIWYQSRFYRVNLHCRGQELFFRDIAVYSDKLPQPFLHTPATQHGIQQRMPAILDGLHWSDDKVRATGHICLRSPDGQYRRLEWASIAEVTESGSSLSVQVHTTAGVFLRFSFDERAMTLTGENLPQAHSLGLEFEWVPEQSALVGVSAKRLTYSYDGFEYAVKIKEGMAERTSSGVKIGAGSSGIQIVLAQA